MLDGGGGARRCIDVPSPRRSKDLRRGVKVPLSSPPTESDGVFLPLGDADDFADPNAA